MNFMLSKLTDPSIKLNNFRFTYRERYILILTNGIVSDVYADDAGF